MGIKASKLGMLARVGSGFWRRRRDQEGTPKAGYVPVCVGDFAGGGGGGESRRFNLHVSDLEDAGLAEMLSRSAEEFGFRNEGVLRIHFDDDPEEFQRRLSFKSKGCVVHHFLPDN